MSLAERTRFPELDVLRERLNTLFSGATADARDMDQFAMPIDMQETEDEIVVTASLPGMKADDIDVEVGRGRLSIRGESREEREQQEGAWHIQERHLGAVERVLLLPEVIKEDSGSATYADGVLKVTFKKDGAKPVNKVEVKTP